MVYDFAGLGSMKDIRRLAEIAAHGTLGLENSLARNRILAYIAQVAASLEEKDNGGPPVRDRAAPFASSEPGKARASPMSLDTRVEKLMPGLSARERAILVLRSHKAKAPPDPLLRRTMLPDQVAEFNRLIVLMNACNVYLPLYISLLHEKVKQLYLRFHWYETVLGFGFHTWKLAELVPAAKRKQAEEAVGQGFPVVEFPWVAEEHRCSWMNVCEEMDRGIRRLLVSLWQEVRSVDIVLAEVVDQSTAKTRCARSCAASWRRPAATSPTCTRCSTSWSRWS